MKQITTMEAIKLIYGTKGKIFKATFRKKNGQLRRMLCRLGVKKNINGKGLQFKPNDYGLITVYDMEKNGYRMINLLTLKYLIVAGQKYEVINWRR